MKFLKHLHKDLFFVFLVLTILLVLAHKFITVYIVLIFAFILNFSKPLHDLVYKFWLLFSKIVAKINNTILLTVVYFICLTPIALLYKMLKKKPSHTKLNTFFVTRNHTFTKADLENPW